MLSKRYFSVTVHDQDNLAFEHVEIQVNYTAYDAAAAVIKKLFQTTLRPGSALGNSCWQFLGEQSPVVCTVVELQELQGN